MPIGFGPGEEGNASLVGLLGVGAEDVVAICIIGVDLVMHPGLCGEAQVNVHVLQTVG